VFAKDVQSLVKTAHDEAGICLKVLTAYDPVAMTEAKHCFPNEPRLTYADNQSAALQGADTLIIVTEWCEFRSPDFEAIKTKLKTPVIFDGRNLYDPAQVRGMGFEYLAIGR